MCFSLHIIFVFWMFPFMSFVTATQKLIWRTKIVKRPRNYNFPSDCNCFSPHSNCGQKGPENVFLESLFSVSGVKRIILICIFWCIMWVSFVKLRGYWSEGFLSSPVLFCSCLLATTFKFVCRVLLSLALVFELENVVKLIVECQVIPEVKGGIHRTVLNLV